MEATPARGAVPAISVRNFRNPPDIFLRNGKTGHEVMRIEKMEEALDSDVPGRVSPGNLPGVCGRMAGRRSTALVDYRNAGLGSAPGDQAALEKGIRLPDDYPLAKALEDYCS